MSLKKTQQVSHVEQVMLSISEYLSSPPICIGFRIARSLVFCLISCGPLFIILLFCFWSLYCLSFDLGLLIIPLVSSNILGRDKSYFLFVFVFCYCFFVFAIAFVFVFYLLWGVFFAFLWVFFRFCFVFFCFFVCLCSVSCTTFCPRFCFVHFSLFVLSVFSNVN